MVRLTILSFEQLVFRNNGASECWDVPGQEYCRNSIRALQEIQDETMNTGEQTMSFTKQTRV